MHLRLPELLFGWVVVTERGIKRVVNIEFEGDDNEYGWQ
jgi:hypothetical protein